MKKPSAGYEQWLVVFPRGRNDEYGYFEVAEKNEDGTVTIWTRNMGSRGRLKPHIETKPVTTKKERERVDITQRGIQRGMDLMQMQYDSLKSLRDNG